MSLQTQPAKKGFYVKSLGMACMLLISASSTVSYANSAPMIVDSQYNSSKYSFYDYYLYFLKRFRPTPTPVPSPVRPAPEIVRPTPAPIPAPTPVPTPAPISGGISGSYIAPVSPAEVRQPDYTRCVQDNLKRNQPAPSAGTRTGYSVMDTSNNSNLTSKFYGTTEDGYAKRLDNLKNTIDTRQAKVGVIDTGINRFNKDMIGANVNDTQIKCVSSGLATCFTAENDSGIVEIPTTSASGSHDNQMAAVIAGNNGMTNAKIYGSDSVDHASNGGNQFLMMRKLNQDHGVKIFNNSWGSNNTDEWYYDAQRLNYNPTTGQINPDPYRTSMTNAEVNLSVIHDLIMNRDALIVKATGNEGLNDAHDENLAPLMNSNFKKGFITVSSPHEDFNQANDCGRTAEWCVSATSSTENYANNGRLSSYKGTSPATARVAGTAVLVQSAYPWMKNENISQTILGTAKDFAEIAANSPNGYQGLRKVSRLPSSYYGEYYDDGYNYYIPGDVGWENRRVIKNHNGKNITWQDGWGLLDPEAAAKGYGGFYWDNVELDTKGTPLSVFYNDLKGDKGFTKKGGGKLVFIGNNSHKGDSIIEGGSLEINGNNVNSTMVVKGGELTGYGNVANVRQTGGWVNNEGNLNIKGDYEVNTQRGVDAGFKAQFGNMVTVDGKAKLGGTLNLTGETEDGIISKSGSRSTVLRAKRGLESQFDNYRSSSPLFEVTNVEYTPEVDRNGRVVGDLRTNNDVQVTAKRLSAGNVARSVSLTDSGSRVADNLDKVLIDLDARQEAQGVLSSDEKQFANRVFTGFENMNSGAESKLSTVSTNRELYKLDPTFYADSALNAVEDSAIHATEFGKRVSKPRGVWGNISHHDYDVELEHATSARKGNSISVGASTQTAADISVGAQLDVGNLDLSESVYGIGNSTKTDSIGLTVGASKKLGDAYVLGWVKGAKVDTEASRGENSNKVEYNGKLYGAGIQAGTNIDTASGVSVQPYAFVNHQQYKNDGSFNDGLNIVNDVKANQTQVGVGADMVFQATPALQLTGGLQLAHAVSRDTELNAQYVGTSTDLSYGTWNTDKTKWLAKVGASYSVTPNSQVGLNYSYTGSGDSDASQVGLSFTSKF